MTPRRWRREVSLNSNEISSLEGLIKRHLLHVKTPQERQMYETILTRFERIKEQEDERDRQREQRRLASSGVVQTKELHPTS
jgi:hypothetical protein